MNDEFVILAIDDVSSNLDILLSFLEDYDVIPSVCAKKGIEIANSENVSLILLDINMPDLNGYEACKILKNSPKTEDIPIIFITSNSDEQSIELAYEVGCDDYISKPLKRGEVLARVNTQLKLKKTIKDLEYLASYDSMTGAFNRRKFFELAISLFDTHKRSLFATMIDIDNFKQINDTYGHNVGDLIIKECVKVIKNHLPKEAILGRVGGEEFAVVLESDEIKSVVEMFDKIKDEIQSQEHEVDRCRVKFTISSGIAKKELDIKGIDSLLKEADEELYRAKSEGKNRVNYRDR